MYLAVDNSIVQEKDLLEIGVLPSCYLNNFLCAIQVRASQGTPYLVEVLPFGRGLHPVVKFGVTVLDAYRINKQANPKGSMCIKVQGRGMFYVTTLILLRSPANNEQWLPKAHKINQKIPH